MKRKGRTETIQMSDVAQLAGVSVSTVSRALAGSPLVNKKTRDLIVKIASEKNYRLNTAARNFRLKESLTIALLTPMSNDANWRLTDPFFLELMGCVAEAVDNHGHQLLLSRMAPQGSEWIQQFVNKHTCDGLILIGQGSQHEAINHLAENYKAISVWGAKVDENQAYPVVGTDNRRGGYKATHYLLQKGRRRIMFLGYSDNPETKQRYQGYQDALAEANIDFDSSLCRPVDTGAEDAYLCLQDALREKLEFDAIFAASDVFAMSAIKALQNNGISVPDNVSVIGYDDISIASYYHPALTTVHQNLSVGGKILVDNLLEAIEGHKPEAIVLDPELVIRESA